MQTLYPTATSRSQFPKGWQSPKRKSSPQGSSWMTYPGTHSTGHWHSTKSESGQYSPKSTQSVGSRIDLRRGGSTSSERSKVSQSRQSQKAGMSKRGSQNNDQSAQFRFKLPSESSQSAQSGQSSQGSNRPRVKQSAKRLSAPGIQEQAKSTGGQEQQTRGSKKCKQRRDLLVEEDGLA